MRESELLNCLTEIFVYLIFCSPDILIFIIVVVQLLSSVQCILSWCQLFYKPFWFDWTLTGGRVTLDSWLSTVARMAFCSGKGGKIQWEQPRPNHPPPSQRSVPQAPHLEEFKKHVVEVGGDIDHVNRLFGVGCCQGSPDQRSGDCQEVTIQHSFTST